MILHTQDRNRRTCAETIDCIVAIRRNGRDSGRCGVEGGLAAPLGRAPFQRSLSESRFDKRVRINENDSGAGGSLCRLVSTVTPPVRLGRPLPGFSVAHGAQGLLCSARRRRHGWKVVRHVRTHHEAARNILDDLSRTILVRAARYAAWCPR